MKDLMGLLTIGTPLAWEESRQYNNYVHKQGVEQLLQMFKKTWKRDNDPLYWGDEVEYMMLDLDAADHNALLDINHDFIVTEFNEINLSDCNRLDIEFHPEYGRYMI